MLQRTIHLRRPPTLSVQEGVFLPQVAPGVLAEVDRRWAQLQQQNPAYFDGRLYHVLGVHRNGHGGAVLHVINCAYRFFATQDQKMDLGVRALGVKGITLREDMVLLGLRSDRVAFYRNMWEFAPGGSVCPDDEPAELVKQELQEETGLTATHEPTAEALLFDPVLRCWEIVYRILGSNGELRARPAEYSALQWRQVSDLPQPLSPIAQQIAKLAPRVLSSVRDVA